MLVLPNENMEMGKREFCSILISLAVQTDITGI